MDEDRMPKEIFLAEVIGGRPVGRPRKDWKSCLEEAMCINRVNPAEWFEMAHNREEWRILSRVFMG